MKLEYLNNIIIGGWQLAVGHSNNQTEGVKVIEAYYNAGFRTFDCADIYTGVEDTLGAFIRAHGMGAENIHIHTKYVPDMGSLVSLTKDDTEAIIDRSRARLGLDKLDLVQFHWWHYPTGNYLAALESLKTLKQAGKIRNIGLTNFDAQHVQEILDHDIPIASIQSQYSLIDRRVASKLEPLLLNNNIALLCYGSVAGGLLSDAWLGKPEPQAPYENRSLVKYVLMVEEMGGWDALQSILETLRSIADTHESDIASIASTYCLHQPAAQACIVGVRNTKHLEHHVQIRQGIQLSEGELTQLDNLRAQFKPIPGAVYELERDVGGQHGRIMKYNLNKD
ncbi:MAG: aldo/keto reductase [Deinococcota bacterium]